MKNILIVIVAVHQMASAISYRDIITKKRIVRQMQTIVTVVMVTLIHLVYGVLFIIKHHPMVDSKFEKIIDMSVFMQNHMIPRNSLMVSSERNRIRIWIPTQKKNTIFLFSLANHNINWIKWAPNWIWMIENSNFTSCKANGTTQNGWCSVFMP